MRLGQLARKVGLRQGEVIAFLAGRGFSVEDGSNVRLQDEHVEAVMKEFSPDQLEEAMSELDETEPLTTETPPEIEITAEENTQPPVEEAPETAEPDVSVIRAPKVELPGLKVLGKIEFPEPKKKEPPMPADPENTGTVEPPQPERKPKPERNLRPKSDRRDSRQRVNPIAQRRDQEAREMEKKRKAEAEQRKEQRKQHYFKKFKPAAPTKAVKLIDEPMEVLAHTEIQAPKTLLGRFMKWLTS